MISFNFKYLDLIFFFVFGFFTRFWRLSFPSKVVFDETHFGLYATKYLSHQYYFDIHPPLGKMMLALSAFLGGLKPGFDFAFQSSYNDLNFLSLRFLPAFFGSLLIPLVYLLTREISFSRRVAFLASFLLLFENALIVQSRFILLDIILIFFILLSLYLFLLTKKFSSFSFKWYLFHFLTALSLGIVISIKWIGFGILGIVWALAFSQILLKDILKKENLIKIFSFFFLPLFFYFLFFAVHFTLLPNSCLSNCGDILENYFKKLGERNFLPEFQYFNQVPQGNLFEKFIHDNKRMFSSALNLNSFYYYRSDWYTWPFLARPFPYFRETQGEKKISIYFLGNPLNWWLALLVFLGYFYLITRNYFLKFRMKLPQNFYSRGVQIFLLCYLIHFASFALVPRATVIYHYLPALIFSLILLAIFFEGILEMIFKVESEKEKIFFSNKKANFIFFGFLILVFLSFLFFSPLTYGFPLTDSQFQLRMWLDTWRL
jgi:dolichyl-phosphate-mannose-protein mannosyltransferase